MEHTTIRIGKVVISTADLIETPRGVVRRGSVMGRVPFASGPAVMTVHGISDAAYDKLHKKLGSHVKVFEAAAQYQSPRRHGLGLLCKAHGIDPVA